MSDRDCINCDEPIAQCCCGNTQSYSDVAPVCPHCGVQDNSGTHTDDGVLEIECPACNKRYSLDVFSVAYWTGTKIDD